MAKPQTAPCKRCGKPLGKDGDIHTCTPQTAKPPQLTLKWGTLKGWKNMSEEGMALLRRYHEHGLAMGCAQQNDSPEQKQILCDIANLPGMSIYLDWDGKYITPEEAVKYIIDYGKKAA